MTDRPDPPEVAILMAVYNGGAHLAEQLDSIAGQTHARWRLFAADDGSSDNSRAVLQTFGESHPVTLSDGPRRGAAANFMSLLTHLPQDAPRWVAFADQDDIWLPDRLERGVAALAQVPEDHPALFCSRSWIADPDGQPLRRSPPRPRPLGFANALVQNVVAGNTLLMNPAARTLLQAAAQEPDAVIVHDWWCYQIIAGAGGTIVHDDAPTLLYRQHGGNQIGANDSALERMKRVRMILDGTFHEWNSTNIAALRASSGRLTPEARRLVEEFAAMRAAPLVQRLIALRRLGLYRQSLLATLALWIAAVLNRL
ncbi:UDP-Glc:alpha-D-GlcNAc-diphosphoundecaprenol beta-1,3-glucosyltransferase WfgD [Roseivivax jejudonensis]|uniref:UDP-Glc:alpha-D-GlcNAc-diphosphoundecaprenol beta-1,3-glucosyltransferase WfgD n=1 Tax=Roseivivax jejudonensis TaxID=1529041 RepID=A0A1X6ZNW3_9RHOB|nr:glycosyltransferase family 2 protein [Roseivivax jejudonensis]SLN56893.1 UDP-Glc:alpha-D-GlcNAc-diphosphoundecaprenol beta-1,3-glucosyltransferase WfgD [Roseivivax jejudonensis]